MSWNNFKAPNIGLLVYKRLYTETNIFNQIRVHIDERDQTEKLEINVPDNAKPFDLHYQSIYNKTLADYSQIENPYALQKFSLFTTYPGLLLGTGYTHDSNAKGDIKIGFFFDHTTGQPVIPGSTVKGVLKSVFENEDDHTDKTSVHNIRFFIEEILQECNGNEKNKWQNLHKIITDENIELLNKLKEDIFGNQDNEGKDMFFDAVIDLTKTNINEKFLANDFITPHHPNLLKNPNPLMFIKVRSNIAFEFRFNLSNSKISHADKELTISSDIKKDLFKQIILTLGIGAKTNVGYGQFFESDTKKNSGTSKSITQHSASELNPGKTKTNIVVGDILTAKVISLSGGITIDLGISDISFKPRITGVSHSGYSLNQQIKVRVDENGKYLKLALVK